MLGEKDRPGKQMKWDYEDEGTCWLNICVNGTLDFSFPISAMMTCFKTLALEISATALLTLSDNSGAAHSSSSCI